MNNLQISCNYPLVHIAHMTEGGEERRIRNIASEVNEDNAKVEKARETHERKDRSNIEVIFHDIKRYANVHCYVVHFSLANCRYRRSDLQIRISHRIYIEICVTDASILYF